VRDLRSRGRDRWEEEESRRVVRMEEEEEEYRYAYQSCLIF
jgi:hypothetical protein